MARGRVLTPDFWTDEQIIGLTPFARLLYLGLWNFAYCDKGHLPDEPLGLKLKILPNDQVDPRALMEELVDAGRVVRVNADGKAFLWMPSFEKHQKTDVRWKTRCPACALQDSLKLTETQASFPEHTETHLNSALREEKRTRENRTEQEKAFVQDKPAHSLDSEFAEFWAMYPRKQGKADALKAFKVIRKKHDAKKILAGAQAYALLNIGEDKSFLKLPGGWLRGERWEDEQIVNATRTTTTNQPAECVHHPGYPVPCARCARDEDERDF